MSDLIKRSDAIKVLKDSVVEMGGDDFCEMGVHIDDIEAVVNAIPSADKPTWIPCSERLPEEEGVYLVTVTNCIFDTEAIVVGTCYFNIEYGGFFSNNKKILAWMPLPQPWKGADDE